ncbi:MAG: alanine--tRNA ligase, partial [Flavobacteriales bacterium]
MLSAIEIRQKFLQFFENKGHQLVPSAPLVLKNDPTLMFVNAGMNPFKDLFLGNSPIEHPRVSNSQKCLRVSGKHNDLEEVGYDTYHHTLFEMLGNWSFGDYFKEDAISWAWELLTEGFGLDKDILYVSVFEGDRADKTEFDHEANTIWKTFVDESHIVLGNKKDNFWEMGDVGPCGPCSEIHIDLRSAEERAKINGKDLVNADHPQVIEIWNLVFMQFNRKADGSLEDLPNKHVDTGMGFERLVRAIQKKTSNYDTDVFQPILKAIENQSNMIYGKAEKIDIAMRVIADHLRAVSFAIADGQLPSSNGAGYVIRRILRRASRYAYTYLKQENPFIYQLVDSLISSMGSAFPELEKQADLVKKVIQQEEQSFLRTLSKGLLLLEQEMENASSKIISGKKAFQLYDTFGFPADLTQLIASEQGFEVDMKGMQAELRGQIERGQEASASKTDDWEIFDDSQSDQFVGYDDLICETNILACRKVEQKKKTFYQLTLNHSPFYAEGGGQVGDVGQLICKDDVIAVFDTKIENNQRLHFCNKAPKYPQEIYQAQVNASKRQASACNHSATHLLHFALRSVLGTHVEQKGSLVNADYLRFDFSHFSKLSEDELQSIENQVNSMIINGLILNENRQSTLEEAKAKGAMALFGEKYGDTVRTIQFGESIELCGGTHVANSSEIGLFKLKSESAVAAGIRRIEAITQQTALQFLMGEQKLLDEIRVQVKNPKHPLKAVQQLQADLASNQKKLEHLLAEKSKQVAQNLEQQVETTASGLQILAQEVDLDMAQIKTLAFGLEKKFDKFCGLFASSSGEKANLTIIFSKSVNDASEELHAGKLIKTLGKHIQGGGGGQAHFASAGGKNKAGIPAAIQEFKRLL